MSNSKLIFIVTVLMSLCFLFSACGAEKTDKPKTTVASSSVSEIVETTDISTVSSVVETAATTEVITESTKISYYDYSRYIGTKKATILEKFGKDFKSEDCTGTLLYKYESKNLGFHFDNLEEITDDMTVRMVRVYGEKYINKLMRADMTFSELKNAVADKTSVSSPEQYSDTEYSVQIIYKGINYNFMFEGNPSQTDKNAEYVDISK